MNENLLEGTVLGKDWVIKCYKKQTKAIKGIKPSPLPIPTDFTILDPQIWIVCLRLMAPDASCFFVIFIIKAENILNPWSRCSLPNVICTSLSSNNNTISNNYFDQIIIP